MVTKAREIRAGQVYERRYGGLINVFAVTDKRVKIEYLEDRRTRSMERAVFEFDVQTGFYTLREETGNNEDRFDFDTIG